MSFEVLFEIAYYVYWIGFWCTFFASLYHLREGWKHELSMVFFASFIVSIFSWIGFDIVVEQIEKENEN